MKNLAIIAIMKNESHILKEWIEHYLKEGVEHFFLIDNGSNDNTLDIIAPYVDKGIASIIIDNKKYSQKKHYNRYYLKVAKSYKWVIICDLDEFIYARNGFCNILEYLNTLDDNIGSVYIPWKLFGSSSLKKQPKLVVYNFTYRAIYSNKFNQGMLNKEYGFCKSIIRTKFLKKIDIHISKIKKAKIITSDGKQGKNNSPFQLISEDILEKSYLHLNHYAIQSLEWFENIKMSRGDATAKKKNIIRTLEYFKGFDYYDKKDEELKNKRYL